MNTDSISHSSEQIWQFLHGEMNSAEQAAFAARVRQDARLEAELHRQRQLHLLLKNAAAEPLADRLLREYQSEQEVYTPAAASPPGGRVRRLPKRNRLYALAACAAVVAGTLWMTFAGSPLTWAEPRVIACAFRAGDPAPPPGKYAREALLAATGRVTSFVNAEVRRRGDPGLRALRKKPLQMSIEEIFAGQVSLTVEVPGRGAWTGNYASLDALNQQSPQIAVDLVDFLSGRPALRSP